MMTAVGEYLKTLREQRGLSRQDVADNLGVTTRAVVDWENGKHAPGSDKMAKLIALLYANPGHIQALMMDTGATAETGRRLARQSVEQPQVSEVPPTDDKSAVLTAKQEEQFQRLLASLDSESLEILQDLLREARVSPLSLAYVEGFVRGLLKRTHPEQTLSSVPPSLSQPNE
jgi:transcriptional regulator with XRE-family HTH domain